jgi:hypothetical protein
MEECRVTVGTQFGGMNVITPQPGIKKLTAVLGDEIEVRVWLPVLLADRWELDGDFGSNLVTANPDGGADCDFEILGLAAKVVVHLGDGMLSDLLSGSAPACVNGAHCAALFVDEEQWHAVGGANREQASGVAGEKSVSPRTRI